jgi:F-type H+-transporting ATPase subunit b
MEGLGINLGYFLVQVIAFIVIYTLLTRFIYDPLTRVLKDRRTRIQKGLEDAAAAANARRNAEADAEKILAQARADAARVIEEARTRGDELAKTMETAARNDGERIRAEARTASEEERNRQLADLRGQVAAIGVAVAERLIGESLDAKRQQALINDFFAKVPADARAMGGTVEVISAMPLSDKEQAAVRKEVGAKDVEFKVDPSILGGLVVRSADRVVDGSVRSGLSDLSSRLR